MEPRTIEVTELVRLKRDGRKFYVEVGRAHYWGLATLARPDLEKLRDAIGEMLEETLSPDTKVHRAITAAWREVGEAGRLATKHNDTTTAVLCLEHQETLNRLAFVWAPPPSAGEPLEDDE